MKKILAILSIVLVLGAFASCGPGTTISAGLTTPVYERPPQPYPDYVWIDGDWYPQGGTYVYRHGYWAPPRRNHVWVTGTWEHRGNGYYWRRGRWH